MAAVDVVPSPKAQLREAIVPSLSVEVSVKLTVNPLTVEVKLATGGLLPGPPENKEYSRRFGEPRRSVILPGVALLTMAV